MDEEKSFASEVAVSEAESAYAPNDAASETEAEDNGDKMHPGVQDFDISDDVDELIADFEGLGTHAPEELCDTERYKELRALGLSPRESFLATQKKRVEKQDSRAHLGGVPKSVGVPGVQIPAGELKAAREIFVGMSDAEIRELYRRVTR